MAASLPPLPYSRAAPPVSPTWGVLRGDVDNFAIRIHRAQSIEEHIQLSVMYKQFFAGELEVLCSMPEFWRKVTVIYSGGDDFAVYGAWDALIGLASELERLFRRFAEQNLKDFAGPEGKTISMALAMAPAVDASLGAVFEEAGQRLEAAKSADKDCIWLLGRTLEWKQFAEAATLKDFLGPHGERFRLLAAVSARSVRHVSRDAIEDVEAAGPAHGWRAAVAVSSPHPPDPERLAQAWTGAWRLSKGAHGFDRRSDRSQRRDRQVATGRPRGARMGEVVRRGVRRDFNGRRSCNASGNYNNRNSAGDPATGNT